MKFFRVIVLIACGFIMHPEYALSAGPAELAAGLKNLLGKLDTLDKELVHVAKSIKPSGPSVGGAGKPAAGVPTELYTGTTDEYFKELDVLFKKYVKIDLKDLKEIK